LISTVVNLNISLLIIIKCCLCFQPLTCVGFGRHSHSSYTSFCWLTSLPCYECFVHSKTSPLIAHHFSRSSLPLKPCVCSWLYIWKDPIEGAPTQRPEYPLIHELKMLTITHFWPIHEQQVPPCLHARTLHNISMWLLGVCKTTSMWKNSNNLFFANRLASSLTLVALVSCSMVVFVLLTRLPQHYIGHRSMHVHIIGGGSILATIPAHNY
jgi:hypothetical protein